MNDCDNDDKKDGSWEVYYSDGKLKSSGSFDNGNMVGKWLEYYNNYILWRESTYVDNKLHGFTTQNYITGKLCMKGNYVYGEPNGYFESYRFINDTLLKHKTVFKDFYI